MKTLIVIDMQNDFVTGSLANPAAEAIIPFIKDEIWSGKYETVVFTQDTHRLSDYPFSQEGKNLPIKHCIRDANGWQIVDALKMPNMLRIEKTTFGYADWWRAEAKLGLDSYQKERDGYGSRHENEELVLVGTCTDICVVSNALILKAAFPETKISVLANGCAGSTPERHAAALEVMKSCQINVVED